MSLKPLVGILIGSDSDLPVMEEAAKIFKDFGIPYEMTVRTAGIGDPWMRTSIEAVKIKASVHINATSASRVSVYSNGSVRDPATWGPLDISLSTDHGVDGGPYGPGGRSHGASKGRHRQQPDPCILREFEDRLTGSREGIRIHLSVSGRESWSARELCLHLFRLRSEVSQKLQRSPK